MKKLFFLPCLFLLLISLPVFAGPLPDTGQTKCYDNEVEIPCPQPGEPFYGQDAQYPCNPHSYTDLGNGVIQDNVTGLEWQKATAPGTYTWDPAITYCDNLVLGGYSDWRLPTIKELSTLLDSSIQQPGSTINTTYFPGTVASSYWSSTTDAYFTYNAWFVSFYDGFVKYYDKMTDGLYVRAVRGGQSEPPDHFVDNNDGTVTDTVTGLMWQKPTAPGSYTWEQALTYCENLTLPAGGYSDWRLPNRNELQSIIDYSRYNPSIDPVFSGTVASHYWSSTTDAYYTSYAWGVYFDLGSVYYGSKTSVYYVRAVRGGPCVDDSDGDGILDDGDNSSIVGDNPCTGGGTVNCDDNCIYPFNPDQSDTDSDGVGDLCDNCPNDNNTNQLDIDGDGIGDACDICPNDPDNDIDNDAICGDVDICPNDPTNDADNDTVCGLADNCPLNPNSTVLGTCVKLVSGVFMGNDVVCSGLQDCAEGEYCQMDQEDHNGNGIGDACECYANINGDGSVNVFDLIILKNEYNRNDCSVTPCDADCNDDGNVNVFDLIIMKNQYNRSGCPVVQ